MDTGMGEPEARQHAARGRERGRAANTGDISRPAGRRGTARSGNDGGCSRTQRSRECPPCWKREGLRQSLLHQELLQTHTLEEYWDLGRELYARQPGLLCDAWSGALHLLTCLGYHHGAHVETADMPTLLERKCCNQEPNHRVRPLPHFSLFCLDEGNLRIHRRYREDLMVVRPAREPGDDDREYRHAAYRHFIFWQHGALTRHPQLLCVGDQGQVPRPLRAV
ncbi:uncharacterized protein [Nothobranchius furzeri]|uniref:Transcript variant X1 n=1 Tax=Nothobranchius furzeri TaxID=105023 RepID=A0A1A8U7J8_NOTFU|nr:transcript variant X1 [Nothobranchius furzeri]KAF7208971.1 transcript variant X2 [Nothobranchius furzeri]